MCLDRTKLHKSSKKKHEQRYKSDNIRNMFWQSYNKSRVKKTVFVSSIGRGFFFKSTYKFEKQKITSGGFLWKIDQLLVSLLLQTDIHPFP